MIGPNNSFILGIFLYLSYKYFVYESILSIFILSISDWYNKGKYNFSSQSIYSKIKLSLFSIFDNFLLTISNDIPSSSLFLYIIFFFSGFIINSSTFINLEEFPLH